MNMKDLAMTKKYDFIYGHWSLGYLEDDDLSQFLIRCRASLVRSDGKNRGLMIVKEQISEEKDGEYQAPSEQRMQIRREKWYRNIFE